MRDRSSTARLEILTLVARIATIVLVVEVAVMAGFEMWEDLLPLPKWALSLMDAALLVLISVPIIYAWVIRPYVARRDRAENLVRQVEAELRVHNARFDAALDNMHHGLAMFDAEQRVVVTNDRYAEIYGLRPEHVRPGTTLRQIVEHRIANGLYAGANPEEYIKERCAPFKEASTAIHQLSDGRAIYICRRPMAGGGWVTTHQDITEQRRSEAKIAYMAHYDALTDLPNRALLRERLEQAVTGTREGDRRLAVLMLDLDRFKEVNDTLGHPVGDALLKAVAERLRNCVRETDTVARLGGDEFAIVQIAPAQPMDPTDLATRIVKELSAPFDLHDHHVNIGTSIGIAVASGDGADPDQLLKNADLALYRAKSEGRGTYRIFEPAMAAQMQTRRVLERDLRNALANNEFELYYQPIVSLGRNEIIGCEALLRWRHPARGIVLPGEFIALAEEIGLIVPLGEWVIGQACAAAATWPDDVGVSVNLSPAQFKSPGLVHAVVSVLETSRLRPGRLELEITETTLLEGSESTLAMLHQLRELGVRIAMDDFGTGYSSLRYLQSFPFDKIKIDRSFVKDIGDHVGSLNIVRAVAALAHGLGIATTAEGVETKEQLDTVRAEGCTEMQGFLFSRPLPTHEIEHLLWAQPHVAPGKDVATAA